VKKELEMLLEKLEGFSNPKIQLEQYVTPPALAAEIVVNAKLIGDLHAVNAVVDLGCGTGILAIAAALLDVEAIGFDVDCNALRIARKNARNMGVHVDFVQSDVRTLCLKISRDPDVATIMNPPFGIQVRHADRPFLKKAMEFSRVIYSIHSAGSEQFVSRLAGERGFAITHLWKYSIPLRRTYSFHEKAFKYIPVEVFRLERKKDEVRNARR
jgi:putative methylase